MGSMLPTWLSVLVCPLVLYSLDSSVSGNRDSRFLFKSQTFGVVRRKFWVLRSWCAAEKYQRLVKQFWSPLYCAPHKHYLYTLKSVAISRGHGICLQFLCCSVMISHCLTDPYFTFVVVKAWWWHGGDKATNSQINATGRLGERQDEARNWVVISWTPVLQQSGLLCSSLCCSSPGNFCCPCKCASRGWRSTSTALLWRDHSMLLLPCLPHIHQHTWQPLPSFKAHIQLCQLVRMAVPMSLGVWKEEQGPVISLRAQVILR